MAKQTINGFTFTPVTKKVNKMTKAQVQQYTAQVGGSGKKPAAAKKKGK